MIKSLEYVGSCEWYKHHIIVKLDIEFPPTDRLVSILVRSLTILDFNWSKRYVKN